MKGPHKKPRTEGELAILRDHSSASIEESLQQLLQSAHDTLRLENHMFRLTVDLLGSRQARREQCGQQLAGLWRMLTRFVCMSHFDAADVAVETDTLTRFVLSEMELGSADSRAACCDFLSRVEENVVLKSQFAVRADVLFGGAKSPSWSTLLQRVVNSNNNPGELEARVFLAPLLRVCETATRTAIERGQAVHRIVFGHFGPTRGANFLPLLSLGSCAYELVCLAMFPVYDQGATKKSSRKDAEAKEECLALLRQACEKDLAGVSPFFGFAVAWHLQHHKNPDAAVELVNLFLELLRAGQKSDFSVLEQPHLASLIMATKGLQFSQWRRKWATELANEASEVASRTGGHVSEPLLASCTALLKVEPTVSFDLLDVGFLKMGRSASEGANQFAEALIEASTSLRVLHELLSGTVSTSVAASVSGTTLRDAVVRQCAQGSAAVRNGLKLCSAATAKLLALVPKDAASVHVVCAILRWGPIGQEAVAAGWDPAAWARAIGQWCSEHWDTSRSAAAVLYKTLLNTIHYRWSPATTKALVPPQCDNYLWLMSGKRLDLSKGNDGAESTLLCLVHYWRLARDFPMLWRKPDAAASSGAELLQHLSTATSLAPQDWTAVLWAGGLAGYEAWLRLGPLILYDARAASSASASACGEEAWGVGGSAPQEVRARTEIILRVLRDSNVAQQRKADIASLAPLSLLCACSAADVPVVLDAVCLSSGHVRMAQLLSLVSSGDIQVWKSAVKRKWLSEGFSFGPGVAAVLDDADIWTACLKQDDAQMYLDGMRFSPKHVEFAKRDPLAFSVWTKVLQNVALEDWQGNGIGKMACDVVFKNAWRERRLDVLVAFHDALFRLNLDVKGIAAACRVSLSLLASYADQMIAFAGDHAVEQLVQAVVGRGSASWAYEMALQGCVDSQLDTKVGSVSAAFVRLVLALPYDMHDRVALGRSVNALLERVGRFADKSMSAACVERLIRVLPPLSSAQLSLYLQLCFPEATAASVRASVGALVAARRGCPEHWAHSAGIVSTIEARALYLVSHLPEELTPESKEFREWVAAAAALGRAIGGGGADLASRKPFLALALADWLSRAESRALREVRKVLWDEGLVCAMEAVSASNADKEMSFALVRGGAVNKAAWKRYRKEFQETDQFRGKI